MKVTTYGNLIHAEHERAVIPAIMFLHTSEDIGDETAHLVGLALTWWKWAVSITHIWRRTPKRGLK